MVSHLAAKDADKPLSQLIISHPNGGYIADGYGFHVDYERDTRQWYINPFKFLGEVFDTHTLAIPDTTTLAGRRIYYSHIDGDGWRNLTLVPKYRGQGMYSSEVLLKELFIPYPELPISVGPVTVDLDPKAFGTDDSQRVAREIFKLPHIEAASHTHSHPLQWSFFAKPFPGMEQAYRHLYPKRIDKKARSLFDLFGKQKPNEPPPPDSSEAIATYQKQKAKDNKAVVELKSHYSRPRAYFTEPYSTNIEIQGSLTRIQPYLPAGKRVETLLWSGNTQPYVEALRATRDAGIRNLNGGDTRFDRKYNSYAWVSPVGRTIADQVQIYSSNSNENTYTNLWTGPFYGFRHLTQTFDRTETPLRVKPMNVYYHMYSGERQASLQALWDVYDHVKKQDYIPITASHFAGIGDGFFSTQIQQTNDNTWLISQRDQLSTIRFDHATFMDVDLDNSDGVLGMRHFQGSLYVHLDPSEPTARIKTHKLLDPLAQTTADRPYLIDSHWPVSALDWSGSQFSFDVQGFGPGNMHWWVTQAGEYELSYTNAKGEKISQIIQSSDHQLTLTLNEPPYQATRLEVRKR